MQRKEKISKLKKLYYAYKDGYFVKSIKEFLDLDWVKRFKNTSSFKKHPLEKEWLKKLNHKRRTSAKKEIQECIQEYEDRYSEFICNNCEHLIGKTCTKHYISYPENTCKDFSE